MPTEQVYELIKEWTELKKEMIGSSDPLDQLRIFLRMKEIQTTLEASGIIRLVSDPELPDGSFYEEQRISPVKPY